MLLVWPSGTRVRRVRVGRGWEFHMGRVAGELPRRGGFGKQV